MKCFAHVECKMVLYYFLVLANYPLVEVFSIQTLGLFGFMLGYITIKVLWLFGILVPKDTYQLHGCKYLSSH